MRSPIAAALSLAAALLGATVAQAEPVKVPAEAWQGCCELPPWAEPLPVKRQSSSSGLFGGLHSIVPGSATRHRRALEGGVPAPYTNMQNPLPPTPENVQRGASIYEAQCASCHGATGLGDGPASGKLASPPPPAELGWLARVGPHRRDGFMYWSIDQGGAPLGTSMPGYKGKLTVEEIWSVIGYVEARLPKAKPAAR